MYRHPSRNQAVIIAAAIGLCAIGINGDYLKKLWPITWIGTVLALGFASSFPLPRLVARLFSKLGDISYPLYLAHLPLFIILDRLHTPAPAIIYLPAALLLGLFLDQAVDRPLKKLIKTLSTQRQRQRNALTAPAANLE
jgi:peptidoglycan/LPS O-acetylase OafA/YrhL